MKKVTLNYLKGDVISLLQVIYEFNKYIYNTLDVEVTSCLTITGLGLKSWQTNHIKDFKLPLINKKNIYQHIKSAYFGGLSEVYRPYGEDLYYYDINSLYPFQALNPMPGHECTYIEDFSDKGLDLSTLFGFFYCKIKTKDGYLGLLPYKCEGLLTHPLGEWEGWYFTALLKYALEKGYEIKVIKGYNFNKLYNVFDTYITYFFDIKSKSKGFIRLISKLFLNALLGRFGLIIDKDTITNMVNKEEYIAIYNTRLIKDEVWITENTVIVQYSKSIQEDICLQHGIDYVTISNKNPTDLKDDDTSELKNVSVAISAAVTAYSNVYMSKMKQQILDLGGKLYYTDTDSIVTDIELPSSLVGKNLGQFKLEYSKIKRGYFITSKTYCLILDDKDVNEKNKGVIIKAKGVNDNTLSEKDFIDLLNGKTIKAKKYYSEKNIAEGYVTINNLKYVELDGNVFKKRKKIYENGVWTDTYPLKVGD